MGFLEYTHGKSWIVALHSTGESGGEKDIITESAIAYLWARNIKPENCFSNRTKDTASWFKDFTGECLKPVTMGDSLYVVAHGNTTSVGPYTAEGLATCLHDRGLREVGLISIKACSVGQGKFVTDFRLAASGHDLHFGWIKAYCGTAYTVPSKEEGKKGSPHEKIKNDGEVLEGADRYRMLRGYGVFSDPDALEGRYARKK
jgi:hypothetical protein